jgi:hypothetical protein
MNEERFVKIVEEDMQRIGRWVTQQAESLHTKLGMLLTTCGDETYPVDYLRGEHQRAPLQPWEAPPPGLSGLLKPDWPPPPPQSKLTRWARRLASWTSSSCSTTRYAGCMPARTLCASSQLVRSSFARAP